MLIFPKAKINIGLYVTRKRPDGYHDIETVFYPIPLHDRLETRPLRGSDAPYAFQSVGLSVPGRAEDNLVLRVLRDVQSEFDLPAIDVWLDKHIPMGAGLGGGSSDAACMLRALNEDYALGLNDTDMEQRVARYGADCAFFIKERPAYATGIGDVLSPVQLSLAGLTLVLVKPDVFVSTREAYAGVTPRPASCNLPSALAAPVGEWRTNVFNDFEPSVFRAHPEIAAVKATLYDMGALYASMSGSGSAVFGLFSRPWEDLANVFKDCFVFQQQLRI